LNVPHPKIWIRNIFGALNQFLSSWYVFFFLIPILPENFYTYNPIHSLSDIFKLSRKQFPKKSLEIIASGIVQDGAFTAMLNYYRNFFFNYFLGKHLRGKENYDILCPMLVIWGENDVALTKKTADCREFAKDFSLKFIPNCSHFILQDAPDVVLKNALPFLEDN